MSAKRAKKERKVFNIYNLLVLLSIVIILGSAYVLLERQGIDVVATIKEKLPEDWFKEQEKTNANETANSTKTPVRTGNVNVLQSTSTPVQTQDTGTTPVPTTQTSPNTTNVVNSGVTSEDEISEDKAAEIAIAQFKEMGETSLQKSEIEIMQIQRSGELYYYVSSPENTAEIKVKGGKITRLNSILVDN